MQQVIGEILPLALGIAISPLSIVAVILMLITPKARANGLAFLAGWFGGLVAVGAIALILASVSGAASSSDGSTTLKAVLKLVLGVLLLALAARQWRMRPAIGVEPALPAWMASLDGFTPARSLGTAALLSGINPKNLALNLAAMSVVAASGLDTASQAAALVAFAVVGSLGVLIPIGVYLLGGDRAATVLGGWKAWLVHHNSAIMAVLLLVLGVTLVGQGIAAL